MKKPIDSDDRYTDAPADVAEALATSEPVEDDFPSPEELKKELSRTVTIRLDPAVYVWFRSPEPEGYQTRINDVLRYYVSRQQAKATAPRRSSSATNRRTTTKKAARGTTAKKAFARKSTSKKANKAATKK